MVEMERTEWSDLRQENSNKIEAPDISYLEGWATLNKEFRKAANADKRDYIKERCQHLEQSNKNPKEVSKVIKEITGKWAPQTEVINDKDGNTLTESEAITKRWAEHCHQLYQEPQNHQWTRSHEHERESQI